MFVCSWDVLVNNVGHIHVVVIDLSPGAAHC